MRRLRPRSQRLEPPVGFRKPDEACRSGYQCYRLSWHPGGWCPGDDPHGLGVGGPGAVGRQPDCIGGIPRRCWPGQIRKIWVSADLAGVCDRGQFVASRARAVAVSLSGRERRAISRLGTCLWGVAGNGKPEALSRSFKGWCASDFASGLPSAFTGSWRRSSLNRKVPKPRLRQLPWSQAGFKRAIRLFGTIARLQVKGVGLNQSYPL